MGEEAQKQFQPTAKDRKTQDSGLFTYPIFQYKGGKHYEP